MALAVGLLAPGASAFAYTAKPGDSMWKIANAHHLTLDQIIHLNPQIKDPDFIMVGESINLDTNKVKKPAGVNREAQKTALSPSDRQLLAQLVHAEADGEPFEGKVKVAQVVLNRVKDPRFPDTVKAVIEQPGQFTPVATGAIHNTPAPSDYEAVDRALATENRTDGSLYFYNPKIAKTRVFNNMTTTAVIGHHVFKK